MIQAVLNDAEEKQLTNKAVKMWMDDLQDLAYDVEDILDEYATQVLERELMTEQSTNRIADYFSSWTPSALISQADMKSKIEEITSRLEDLCEEKNDLGLKEIAEGSSTVAWQRPPSTCVPTEPAVIGRDADKAEILEMVLSDKQSGGSFHVIPIVGLGGVGKTTLAREVYNDKAVSDFNPRAWTCVSDDFDVLRISKAILESITASTRTPMNLNEVQVQLKNNIAGKKFLLILDDVWSKDYDSWEDLKSPFLAGAPGSKIIVTTRSKDVASTMELEVRYDLELLPEDVCWAIFEKHVNGSRVIAAKRNMELIRGKVVKKCKGLPLAARTLAGLLRSKQKYDEWVDILDSEIWDLPEESNILPVLKLSYYHLPSHLKRCFSYCAIFPKDYQFNKEELVLLWMAEGLIQQSNHKKQLEDLGGEYFGDLLSRSIFQRSSINNSKYIMHDLVNDLAQWISGERSFRLEDECSLMSIKRFDRIRHSSYTFRRYEVKKDFEALYKVESLRTLLRTFLPSRHENTYVTKTLFLDLLPRLKKLRALSLTNYLVMELPSSIGDLKHLRYINLSKTGIKYLPESTCLLFNLQSLMLRYCRCLEKLPSHLGNLINLRHFDIRGSKLIMEMPLGVKQLKYLKTLSNFIVGEGIGSSLKDLKSLKFLCGELCISHLENAVDCQDTTEMILCEKKDLEALVLEWSSSNPSQDEAVKIVLDILQPHENLKKLTIRNYGGQKLSSWIGDPSFSNMVDLKLDGCENCTTLPSLALMGSLQNLTIRLMGKIKNIGGEVYGEGCSKSFQSLQTLCFENLQEWEHWDPVENDHVERFPRLQTLSISQCPKLSGRLPNHLPLLDNLMINGCEQLVVSFSSLPMLRSLVVDRCKGMVCCSPVDSEVLNSMSTGGESNFPVFRSWSREGFQKLEHLSIVGCEELIHLWPNKICPENAPQELSCFTSLQELHLKELRNLVSFPDGLLSILSSVTITKCDALTSLHEGLKHSNARLKYLKVDGCLSLKFIVRGRLPSSLNTLAIYGCENLMCVLDDREDICTSSPSSSYSLVHRDDVDNTSTSLLYELIIYECHSLTHLSSTDQLPSTLARLSILQCSSLGTLGQLSKGLVSLSIIDCPKLESLAAWSFDCNMPIEYLSIQGCENLKSIPEGLHTLCKLRRMSISYCSSLVSFPKDGFPDTDLEVSISYCEKPQALPSRMHTLKSLQKLSLWECPNIESITAEDFPPNLKSLALPLSIYKPLTECGWHKLTSLRSLSILGSSFPEEEIIEMKFPTSLIDLSIVSFAKLKYLSSKTFQVLTSLESWTIGDCPNLTSLPDLPSSLLSLYIYECPLIEKQCKRNEGQEWSKIVQIPRVAVNHELI
ncbi:putative disease resistance RPP13-like protein 1 [Pistacia vera]|uniref:putative disease resistance RPP13-like protein 1 n=1 Tax=Pistacia vera TaxID=55513 RepID=UPI001262DE2C|nr:putative disease resistance RPP13-like protein 1 [Pistacia vera]